MSVRLGIDSLIEQRLEKTARIALMTNDAACTTSYIPSRQVLAENGYKLVRLFSPEHGLQAVGPDGHSMPDGIDPLTHLPVKSLYGTSLKPSERDLQDVDIVIVDLPDVGSRCYTYLWTMTYVMEACAEIGKRLIVLDRPNPISGLMQLAEGPGMTDERCASFIGRWDIPLRHSCTFGELAQFWRATRFGQLDLRVVTAQGWRREMFYHDWAPSFVPTSPAIASFEACLVYPGLCLSEATNLSEGRGTPLSFRVVGAPWLRSVEIAEAFNRLRLTGITARAITFVPEIGQDRGHLCQGVMLHPVDVLAARPVRAAVMLIKLIHDAQPDKFTWTTYPTAVNPDGTGHLDKLFGVADAELLFARPWKQFCGTMDGLLDCSEWQRRIAPYLLYA